MQSIKIGKYPTTTLSSAREKANIFNNMLTEKIDPKEQIQKEDIKKSKTLIIHLNSYLEAENNLQKIKILVKIYQNLQKCSRTPDLIDIKELEFIFEELFYALGGLGGIYSVEMIQSRIANFIKILRGEPKLLLEQF
ncbi:hypothetical protein O5G10_001823 [Campylobacter jejuni]|nr:hypothetical protein [Campylobacter jejuni]EKG8809231.1 hypothetical protein [Campylobacter jejuni]EKG8809548.1 hypothetical protein [Campylobacter jejuni]